MTTADKDMGLQEALEEMRKLGKVKIDVGVQADGERHKDGEKTLAETAYQNEYGTSRIPARPAHRNAFDDNLGNLERLSARLVKGVQEGKIDAQKAAEILGLEHTNNVLKSINTLKTPPNAPSTIAAKGSSNPLINTEQTIQSVRYVVEGL